jgi:RimJ/RimL family protein N-acetyltransferase
MRITLDASRIRFEAITNADIVNSIYNDEYVKEQYRNDIEDYCYIDRDNLGYIGIYVDNDLAGMYIVFDISPIEIEVHIAFFKEYTVYARDISKEFIRWMFEDNDINRITTYVMDYRRIAVNMALRLGFKYEGFMNKCTIRDGIWYGKHVLGIVRS